MGRAIIRLVQRNGIALVALFLALGGTTYAASTALIGTNTVASPQVVNGSLKTIDLSKKARKALKGNRGLRGLRGSAGSQGAKGATGAQGVQGVQGVRACGYCGRVRKGERGRIGYRCAIEKHHLCEREQRRHGRLLLHGTELYAASRDCNVGQLRERRDHCWGGSRHRFCLPGWNAGAVQTYDDGGTIANKQFLVMFN